MCYEGQHIKLDKKGRISSNGQRIGHLFLRVKFAKNPQYKINGIHLHHSLSIEPWDAATGACFIADPWRSGGIKKYLRHQPLEVICAARAWNAGTRWASREFNRRLPN